MYCERNKWLSNLVAFLLVCLLWSSLKPMPWSYLVRAMYPLISRDEAFILKSHMEMRFRNVCCSGERNLANLFLSHRFVVYSLAVVSWWSMRHLGGTISRVSSVQHLLLTGVKVFKRWFATLQLTPPKDLGRCLMYFIRHLINLELSVLKEDKNSWLYFNKIKNSARTLNSHSIFFLSRGVF